MTGSEAGPRRADLVLFTSSFPFGRAEQFLETELPYLAAHFRRVVVVPAKIHGWQRPVPKGVEVETSLGRGGRGRWSLPLEADLGTLIRGGLADPKAALSPERFKGLVLYSARAGRTRWWFNRFRREAGLAPERTILYTYWLGPITWGLGQAIRSVPRFCLVSRIHGGEIYQDRHHPAFLPLAEQVAERTDRLYTVSDHGQNHLLSRFPGLETKVKTFRLGTAEPFGLARPSQDGVLRLVTCAWLFPLKRPLLLARGIDHLLGRFPELRVQWTHFGDGPLRPELEDWVKDNLGGRVDLETRGDVPNQEVLEHYLANPVDLLVNTSTSEGLPVSIMEAMSFGVPVVATAVGGVSEIVSRDNGRLLSPNPSPAEIGRALAEFVPPSPRSRARRLASRRTWEEGYRAERNYPAFCRDLVSLIDRRTGAGIEPRGGEA